MLWMAPEMLEPPVEGTTPPAGYSGDKVDVYSLGVVFWELMEWRVPWASVADVSKQEVIDAVARRGKAVQVDPIKPTLKAPGTWRLKLRYDGPL